jgi:16S rRNA (guanine(966)-N(2))-methyltransferase RsmD
MVREALFSILGNAVPDRPFFDVFAGTGVVGLEAASRGASAVYFVERDFRLVADLEKHINAFHVGDRATIIRSDVYHWIQRWQPPPEPVTVFLSPPFADFDQRLDDMLALIARLQEKLHPESVLVLQSERDAPLDELPRREEWDTRTYGRNGLQIWVKETPAPP